MAFTGPIIRPAIDYSNGSFMETTGPELMRMSGEELVCRSYYRMEHKLDRCTQEEEHRRRVLYEQVLQRRRIDPKAELHIITEEEIGMTGSVAVLKHCRYFPSVWLRHQNLEMFYVHSGQCTHICRGQEYVLKQGDFCLLECGAPYRIVNHSDDCVILELVVKRKLLDRICDTVFRENSILSRFLKNTLYENANYPMVVFHTNGHPGIQYYVYAMYHEFRLQLPYWEVMLEALLNGLFAMLLWSFRPEQAQPVALENSAVSPMVDYICDHSQTVTLGDLAQVFGYSESHTGKLISAATGMSFSGLLRQARLRRATGLLKNTSLPMNQIALEVGYSDTAYFSRCFRKEFGLPPSEYRQLFAAGQNENADTK